MNKVNFIKHYNFSAYSLSMTLFYFPMIVFCLLVSWGIDVLAREIFRLS